MYRTPQHYAVGNANVDSESCKVRHSSAARRVTLVRLQPKERLDEQAMRKNDGELVHLRRRQPPSKLVDPPNEVREGFAPEPVYPMWICSMPVFIASHATFPVACANTFDSIKVSELLHWPFLKRHPAVSAQERGRRLRRPNVGRHDNSPRSFVDGIGHALRLAGALFRYRDCGRVPRLLAIICGALGVPNDENPTDVVLSQSSCSIPRCGLKMRSAFVRHTSV